VKYRVELSRQAKKAFLALPKRDRRLLGSALLSATSPARGRRRQGNGIAVETAPTPRPPPVR